MAFHRPILFADTLTHTSSPPCSRVLLKDRFSESLARVISGVREPRARAPPAAAGGTSRFCTCRNEISTRSKVHRLINADILQWRMFVSKLLTIRHLEATSVFLNKARANEVLRFILRNKHFSWILPRLPEFSSKNLQDVFIETLC